MASITAYIQGISYFGSNTNKIYTSSDAGVHSTLSDITTNVDCIETHPTLAYNYIGVTDDGVYRHDQSGASALRVSHWIINTPASAGTSYITAMDIDDYGNLWMYHILSGYIFKSNNLGKTSKIVNTGLNQNLTGSSHASGIVSTQNYMFMSMYNAKGCYKLTLTSDTWSAIASLTGKTFAGIAKYKTNGNLYLVGNDGIYYSTDEGTTWTNSRTAVSSGHCVAVNQADGYVYAGITEGGVSKILRSADSGSSWSAVLTGSVVTSISINTVNSTIYIYNSSTTSVSVSVTNGDSWSTESVSAVNVFDKLVVNQELNPTIYAISSTGGVYTSADDISTWTNSVTAGGSNLNSFRSIAINEKTGDVVVGGDSISASLTSPAIQVKLVENSSWTTENIRIGEIGRILFDSSASMWYSVKGSGMFRKAVGSIDNHGFNQINTGLGSYTRVKDAATAGSTLWIVTPGGAFKMNTGVNSSWTASSTGISNLDLLSITVDANTTSRMYVGSNGSGIYKTTDSGANWTYAGLTGHKITSIMWMTDGRIFATSYGSGLYLSIDNGSNWSLVFSTNTSVRKLGRKNASEFYLSAYD